MLARRSQKPADPTARSAESAQPRENVEKILRLIRHHLTRDGGSATLRLDPPHLGSIRIDMDLKHEAIALRFAPADDAAHRLLSQTLDDLKRELQAAGFHLAQMELRPPATAAAQATPQQPDRRSDDDPGRNGDERDDRSDSPDDRRSARRGESGLAAADDGLNVVA